MKGPAAAVLAVAALFALSATARAQVPRTDTERTDVLRHLQWQHGGEVHLGSSKATLSLRSGLEVITGDAVARFWEATQGTTFPGGYEAVVLDPETTDFVVFAPITEGHVALDDWDKVNADELLRGATEATENANKERQANGVDPLSVLGWVETPTLDRTNHTVHWSTRLRSGSNTLINATTLVFGRYGYEKLTWVGEPSHDSAAFLADMRQSFRFDPGARYTDFRVGDKTAAYGVAGLVAALVAGKVAAKIGLLAVLVGVAKKAAILVIALVAGLLSFLKRVFTGKASIEARP